MTYNEIPEYEYTPTSNNNNNDEGDDNQFDDEIVAEAYKSILQDTTGTSASTSASVGVSGVGGLEGREVEVDVTGTKDYQEFVNSLTTSMLNELDQLNDDMKNMNTTSSSTLSAEKQLGSYLEGDGEVEGESNIDMKQQNINNLQRIYSAYDRVRPSSSSSLSHIQSSGVPVTHTVKNKNKTRLTSAPLTTTSTSSLSYSSSQHIYKGLVIADKTAAEKHKMKLPNIQHQHSALESSNLILQGSPAVILTKKSSAAPGGSLVSNTLTDTLDRTHSICSHMTDSVDSQPDQNEEQLMEEEEEVEGVQAALVSSCIPHNKENETATS